MSDLINIKVKKEALMKLLEDRLHHWTDEEDYISLYMKMYESHYDMGLFDGQVVDIDELVDNDWCNNFSIIGVGTDNFDELVDNGEYYSINLEETLMLVRS